MTPQKVCICHGELIAENNPYVGIPSKHGRRTGMDIMCVPCYEENGGDVSQITKFKGAPVSNPTKKQVRVPLRARTPRSRGRKPHARPYYSMPTREVSGRELEWDTNPLRGEVDIEDAKELQIFIENSYVLYRKMYEPFVASLLKKLKKGTYDSQKALRGFRNITDEGARLYVSEFSPDQIRWYEMFSSATRDFVARNLATEFEEKARNQEYDVEENPFGLLPAIATGMASGLGFYAMGRAMGMAPSIKRNPRGRRSRRYQRNPMPPMRMTRRYVRNPTDVKMSTRNPGIVEGIKKFGKTAKQAVEAFTIFHDFEPEGPNAITTVSFPVPEPGSDTLMLIGSTPKTQYFSNKWKHKRKFNQRFNGQVGQLYEHEWKDGLMRPVAFAPDKENPEYGWIYSWGRCRMLPNGHGLDDIPKERREQERKKDPIKLKKDDK